MPSTCVFEFDRPKPVYYAGETIYARLRLKTETEKPCTEIYIHFIGEAKVRWTEQRKQGSGKHSTTQFIRFTSNETYVEKREVVQGQGNLPPGTHDYAFQIALPDQVPSSCVETYGHIKYELILGISCTSRDDSVFRQPITVLQIVNLNLSPEYLLPIHGEDVKYFCCWPCKSGPIVSTLTIPYGGYAPGQRIKYSIQIDNKSNVYSLDGIELRFVQIFEFKSTSPYPKTRCRMITQAEGAQDEFVSSSSKRIIQGKLLIPPVPPTTIEQRIIRVSYKIMFYIKTGCCRKDSKILIPITIGTVPLVQTATNSDNIDTITPSPSNTDMAESLPPDYSLIKPPSYEAATRGQNYFIDEDIEARNRVEAFLPQYPMYTNFALPTVPPTSSSPNELPSTSTAAEAHHDIFDEATMMLPDL